MAAMLGMSKPAAGSDCAETWQQLVDSGIAKAEFQDNGRNARIIVDEPTWGWLSYDQKAGLAATLDCALPPPGDRTRWDTVFRSKQTNHVLGVWVDGYLTVE